MPTRIMARPPLYARGRHPRNLVPAQAETDDSLLTEGGLWNGAAGPDGRRLPEELRNGRRPDCRRGGDGTGGRAPARYLHSCSILSSAWARPLSEYWSVEVVPRPEVPFTVRSAPLRMASTMRASSATFLIQAPSFCVYIANLAVPTSAVASVLVLNG